MALRLQNEFTTNTNGLGLFMNFLQNARASYYMSELLKHQRFFKVDLHKPKKKKKTYVIFS